MQTGMVCSRCTPRAEVAAAGVKVRASGGLQARPGRRSRGRLGGALMAYVLGARRGWDVANLTAGRDQAGG
jgi:hypothetical protein